MCARFVGIFHVQKIAWGVTIGKRVKHRSIPLALTLSGSFVVQFTSKVASTFQLLQYT